VPQTGYLRLHFERLQDDLNDSVLILQDVVVPESQHSKILRPQPSVALLVGRGVSMLRTVDLDDEPRIESSEVDNVFADRDLFAKAMTFDLLPSQQKRQSAFGVCHLLAKMTCVLFQHRV
jgi:hypothetical protein